MQYRRLAGLALMGMFVLPLGLCGQELPTVTFQSSGVQMPGPQFKYDSSFDVLDWNHDGKPDLFLLATGTVGGQVNFNEGTLGEPKFGHAVYWPFNSTETEPQTIEHVSSYTFCDLQHNGLLGLIFFDGQLRYCPNTGTKQGPFHWKLWQDNPQERTRFFPGTDRFVKENSRFSTGPESMYWKKGIFARQALTLTATDWDGDGLQDLLICRFKNEAPGVTDLEAHDGGYRHEQWTAWGRLRTGLPSPAALAALSDENFNGPLKAAPERGLYFYKNIGAKETPKFDEGVEITTPDGKSIAAPNPMAADIDGDGILDLIASETAYRCNAFRVDWPTHPHVNWFRREAGEVAKLSPAQPLLAAGRPVPAGTVARLADFRKAGVNDLLVMDPGGAIRWYKNVAGGRLPSMFAPPVILRGTDFARFEFMTQPLVVDWFGKGSRDLILHGCTDAHCKWALRRTALYRNVAKQLGEVKYELAGYLNYQGDLAMVPVALEERQYDVYGTAMSVFPDDGSGKKRIMMSVGGRLHLFSDLAPDGLTFRKMIPVAIPGNRNRHKGWQEVVFDLPEKTKFIRIMNDRNGMGNLRDSFLHIMRFEAIAGGRNIATPDAVQMKYLEGDDTNYRLATNAMNMFSPDNANSDAKLNATGFGYYLGPAIVELKESARLEKIRFLFSDRDSYWYDKLVPFSWQGKIYRAGMEEGENYYQYKIEASVDGKAWTLVTNRLETEMLYSHPEMIDWDDDGKIDMLLGVTSSNGIYPSFKTYRLYRNRGTNDEPQYGDPEFCTDEKGSPLKLQANWSMTYASQCGMAPRDVYGDGKRALVIENSFGGVDYYRNVSEESGGLKFKLDGHYAALNGQKIAGGGYRYFSYDDVDGDRTPDLIESNSGTLTFYKGVPATAPAWVTDLTVIKSESSGVTVQWTRPQHAASYDLRWHRGGPITELDWNGLTGIQAKYSVAPGALETCTLTGLPASEIVAVALKSLDEKGQASGISQEAEAAVFPLQRLTLRNGLAGQSGEPAYDGTRAVALVATKPATQPAASADELAVLEVRAQDSDSVKGSEKVILIRFDNLPKVCGPVERATLEMMLAPTPTPAGMTSLAVTCNAISKEWDPANASWSLAKLGAPWGLRELETGGACQSYLKPVFTVQTRRRTWDVTPAVREAQQAGRNSVNLLVRVDYTGHYVSGQGLRFCGAEWKKVEDRPKLILIAR